MALLDVKKLTKRFGGVVAVDHLDFTVEEGEILGLIGPNGAGKTTLMNLLSGLINLSKGEIFFQGKKISGLFPHIIARCGISRTFQISKVFQGITVRENVAVGALFGSSQNFSYNKALELAEEALVIVGLENRADDLPETLPHGQQKTLELARAIASQPTLLLLDELIAGLEASEIDQMMKIIKDINRKGTSIIFIEHVVKAVTQLCDRIMVLQNGRKIACGTPAEVVSNQLVIEAYLGKRYLDLVVNKSEGGV